MNKMQVVELDHVHTHIYIYVLGQISNATVNQVYKGRNCNLSTIKIYRLHSTLECLPGVCDE